MRKNRGFRFVSSGVEFDAFLDDGSDLCIIREDLLNKLPPRPLSSYKPTIEGFGNGVTQTLGEVEICIDYGGRSYQLHAVVVKGGQHEFILGMDALIDFDAIYEPRTGTLTFRAGGLSKSAGSEPPHSAFAHLAEKVHVEPGEFMEVALHCRDTHSHFGVLDGTTRLHDITGLC